MHNIHIGTIISPEQVSWLPTLIDYGFETFSLNFQAGTVYDFPKIARAFKEANCKVSNLCMYENALAEGERGEKTRKLWEDLIDAAGLFETDIVAGFAGRIIDKPIPESIGRYKEVFESLSNKARTKKVRLAFENCSMGGDWYKGDWNIAINPNAWELMFEALPADNIGLQWEPTHQMTQLIDPIPQLRKWVNKIFCLHGKDANIAWDVIKAQGIDAGTPYVWHRTPGFGDCNWVDIMTILTLSGFSGTIDIEGYHDPIFKDESEFMGQVYGLKYLKQCRGGDYYANPK